MPGEMLESLPKPEAPKEEAAQAPRRRHLRVVTTEDTIPDMTEELDPEKKKAVPPPIPEEALRPKKSEPTMVEQAEAHFSKEKREMGAAKAVGRDQRAIREAQAALAYEAVDELVAEEEAEKEAEKGFGTEEWKPQAKKPSVWERVKGFFKS